MFSLATIHLRSRPRSPAGLLLPPGARRCLGRQGTAQRRRTTKAGWRPMPAITRSHRVGRNGSSQGRVMCCPPCAAWRKTTPTIFDSRIYGWTSGELTAELGIAITDDLARKLPFEMLLLRVRNDPWFISEIGYPVFPAFFPELSPPTREQYMNWRLLGRVWRSARAASCNLFGQNR